MGKGFKSGKVTVASTQRTSNPKVFAVAAETDANALALPASPEAVGRSSAAGGEAVIPPNQLRRRRIFLSSRTGLANVA